MSDKPINDGGPAFPFGQVSEITGQPINGFFAPGMSLRACIAKDVLTTMLALPETNDAIAAGGITPALLSASCCQWADALIAELEKGGQS